MNKTTLYLQFIYLSIKPTIYIYIYVYIINDSVAVWYCEPSYHPVLLLCTSPNNLEKHFHILSWRGA